ncbi:SCO1431 family membrane protein [Streptomyces lydicus]|nr:MULTISPECIES: SCO1431 family membrane protein [Streptomyces]
MPTTATAARARTGTRTGGPKDDSTLLEHLAGWTLVVVLAMLLTQTGLV